MVYGIWSKLVMWPFNRKRPKLSEKEDRDRGYDVKDEIVCGAHSVLVDRTLEPQRINLLVSNPAPRQYINYFLRQEGIGITESFPILPNQTLSEEEEKYVIEIYNKHAAKLIQEWAGD